MYTDHVTSYLAELLASLMTPIMVMVGQLGLEEVGLCPGVAQSGLRSGDRAEVRRRKRSLWTLTGTAMKCEVSFKYTPSAFGVELRGKSTVI